MTDQPTPNPSPNPVAPPPPPPGYYPPPYAAAPAGKGILSKVIGSLVATVLISSILLNVYLIIMVSASVGTGLRENEVQPGDGQADERIVILPIDGMIDSTQAAFVGQALAQLDDDPPAALILRIESGGGGVTASDQIWHAVKQFQEDHPETPVVASFGGIAASGGYYVAASADHIMAETTCITGSIGVIAQAFTVEEMLEKVGVTPETMVAELSPDKDTANDITRAWDDADRQRLQDLLDVMYNRFTEVVVEGRGDTIPEDTRADVFDGDIYTAAQAMDNGLIDSVGYLSDAVDMAASLASMPAGAEPRVTRITRPVPLFGSLLGVDRGGARPSILERPSPEELRAYLEELSTARLMYLYSPRP